MAARESTGWVPAARHSRQVSLSGAGSGGSSSACVHCFMIARLRRPRGESRGKEEGPGRWTLCHCCCSFCNVSRVGAASSIFVVAKNCASNFSLSSGSVLAMLSICAFGAVAVKLPSRLETSVARVAISASGIVAGAGGGLGGSGGFEDSAFFCSAASTKIAGRKPVTSK